MISLPEFKCLVDPVDSRTIGTAAAIALLPYRTITLATTNSAVSGGSEFGFSDVEVGQAARSTVTW
jgi:hypothetical protein